MKMETKCLQIRDRATRINVIATAMKSDDPVESRMLWSEGFNPEKYPLIMVARMDDGRGSWDTYSPVWNQGRTMRMAHAHIEVMWSSLKSGDVVDVEFILGETTVKKERE